MPRFKLQKIMHNITNINMQIDYFLLKLTTKGPKGNNLDSTISKLKSFR